MWPFVTYIIMNALSGFLMMRRHMIMARKIGARKWSRFMAPVSGACVMGVSIGVCGEFNVSIRPAGLCSSERPTGPVVTINIFQWATSNALGQI